ncbi:MAG TPA: hypothetical protein VG056_01760 [Pirellulales bacterium]|nr:hypothetical protein [Pirellulales bacterium]
MKRLLAPVLVLAAIATAGVARAADDPTGTWKWERKISDQTIAVSLKLKLDGDKLTGTLSARNMDTEIQDGQFKDGDISFTVTRDRNGQKFTQKYAGKQSGDTIKGQVEVEFNGESRKVDWEAKRDKA